MVLYGFDFHKSGYIITNKFKILEVLFIFKHLLSFVAIVALISTIAITPANAAPSRVISATYAETQEIGNTMTTSEVVSRSQLQSFYEDVVYAESNRDKLDNFRFSLVSSIITAPLKSYGLSISAGAGSGILSSFVIENDLGSSEIQNALFDSASQRFLVTITYEKGNRGSSDYWYAATDINVLPYEKKSSLRKKHHATLFLKRMKRFQLKAQRQLLLHQYKINLIEPVNQR